MSIRQYNPGRNRRGRVSIAAERFLYAALLFSITTQIVFLYQRDSKLILASAIGLAIFSLSHAQLAYGKRYFWSYLLLVFSLSTLIELTAMRTAWPFGEINYNKLGVELFSVPIFLPTFWLGAIHPLLILARRIAPNWVLLSGAAAITSYQLFFDQLLVANGYKSWVFTGAHIPFQTKIPLSNLFGWLLVGVIFFGLINLALPKDRRKISASLTSIDISLVWIWLFNVIANLAYFDKPGTAALGGLAFGALLLPYLASRYLGQP